LKPLVKQNIVSFISGCIFAIGLTISGMTQPHKIIGFLSLKNWDYSLLFVMLGAVGAHAFLQLWIRKRNRPLMDSEWHIPTRRDFTLSLIVGSAIFGIGWGLGGFCPGPAIVSLASIETRTIVFVFAMGLGIWIYQKTPT